MLYTKRLEIKLDEEMYEWVRENAHQNNISMAQVIRNVLNVFTKRETKESQPTTDKGSK